MARLGVLIVLVCGIAAQLHSSQAFSSDGPARPQPATESSTSADYKFYNDPAAKDQAKNQWIVVLWSVPESEVALSQEFEGGQKPVELAYGKKGLSGSIDTQHLQLTKGRLVTVNLKNIISPALRPWLNNDRLSLKVPLDIKSFESAGHSVAYVSLNLILRNTANGDRFWFLTTLFDPRGKSDGGSGSRWLNRTKEMASCSPSRSTRMPIVTTNALRGSNLVDFAANSAEFGSKPYAGVFDISISRENFKRILSLLANGDAWCFVKSQHLADNSADYEIEQVSVMVEVYVGERDARLPSETEYSKIKFHIGIPSFDLR